MLIAVKLEQGAVELIGTTLGHDIHYGAEVTAILGREIIGDDLVFLDLVLIVYEQVGPADAEVIVVRTIDLEVVRSTPVSVHRKASAVGVRAAAAVLGDTGNQQRQSIKPTACRIRRQILNLPGFKTG